MTVFSFLKESISRKIQYNEYSFVSLGFLGTLGHPLFWILWTYIDPQKYENLTLRVIGALSCFLLIVFCKYKNKLKNFLIVYWIVAVTYNLPFLFTVFLINNNFSQVWLVAEVVMFLVVIFAIENTLFAIFSIIIGIFLAILFCLKFYPANIIYSPIIIENIPISLFAIVTAIIFSYSNLKGFAVSKEIKYRNATMILKSLAASIAHEIRNPLNTINLIGGQIGEFLRKDIKFENSDKETKQQLINLTSKISEAIKGANDIINIILSDLSDKPIDKNDFCYLEPKPALMDIIDRYGYKNKLERERVKLDETIENKFFFKCVPDRFTFIVYNLLKNALYYVEKYPNSVVTIGTDQVIIEDKKYNTIYVKDTGPGIPADLIPKLFDDFYTSGKKDGTGLGLSFCKRNMLLFGGDIICESEFEHWTKFSLLFPEVSQEELKNVGVSSEIVKREVLIVDDEEVNLLIEKSILEKNLNIICKTAKNGQEALEFFKKDINKYELVLMDLEMPVMDGFTAISEIRGLNSNVPIIAYSSLTTAQDRASKLGANEYIVKPVKKELLTRIIAKWINIRYDLLRDKSLDDIKSIFENKRILIADDEATNRLMLSKYIENFGALVDNVDDGNELVKVFKENSGYDIIISDVNMPTLTGYDAAREIRQYERERNLKSIPIIAFTGDSDMKKLLTFFNAGMTDYIVKGDNNESIIRILGFWLYFKQDYLNHHL